MTTDRQAKR